MNQESGQQEYKEIEKVVGQLFTLLNENQKNLAQEALKSQENNPTFIKGKSLVNLICHDFCLYKYPFSQKYSFDYESWVNTFLESERYEWIIQPILIKIKDQWNITYEDDDIKALYILCGAFTNETNNKNRQKKLLNCLSFALDIDCEDMKYVQQQGINYKLKKSVFKSWVKFLGDVDIVSIGETSKQNSNGLLSYEILNLLQCFKEAEEALDFISERLIVPSESNQNDSINQESCLYSMCYMNYHSKKNIPLIDQQLELRVEQSMTENNQNENQQSSIFYESSIKSKYNQFENESHESAIKSQPDFSSSKKNMF